VSFDTWHQRLIYTESNTICLILSNGLVDSLSIHGELDIEGFVRTTFLTNILFIYSMIPDS